MHNLQIISSHSVFSFSFKIYFYLFLERQREGEAEGEKHQCVVASHVPTGDLACNPGMCPDWESNQGPFGLQVGTQSTEPHQPGHLFIFFITSFEAQKFLILKSNF